MKKLLAALTISVMTMTLATAEGAAKEPTPQPTKKSATNRSNASATSRAGKKASSQKPAPKKAAAGKKTATPTVAASAQEWNGDPKTLGSSAVLVMDQQSGRVLLEKNPDQVSSIASISKLMTAMVALDAGLNLDEIITLSDEDVDYRKGTHSRLSVGTSMSRDTALLLALMSSENRAANALARHYPGGLPAFVRAMNDKARALGLRYTHFVEPTGLSSDNVSTPRELARLVAAAYRYAKIREYSTMAEAELDTGLGVLTFKNTNVLIKNPQWRIGLSKTGYISEAGRCLVMQAWVSERPVLMVLLDSSGKMTRVGDASRIKRWMENRDLPRSTGA